jgi:ABC-type nitrate/sulfonate/bicarbonate transport system substrate-binding protein
MIDGLWGEPILDLGAFKPYILSSLNVPLKTIEDDPETVKRVVRALVRGAQYIYDEPEAALAIAKDALGETTSAEALEMAFARLLAGDGWSIDGRFAEGGLEALTELATSQAEGVELDPDKAFDDQFLDD